MMIVQRGGLRGSLFVNLGASLSLERRPDHARGSTRVGAALLAAGVCGLLYVGGCRAPLLPSEDLRSQFSRYDVVRNQSVPPYLEDEFGRRRPNLRGRLRPPE